MVSFKDTCAMKKGFTFDSSHVHFNFDWMSNFPLGLMTGIGTIDRLKKKAMDTMMLAEEEPIPLKDVFGIAGYHTWLLPIDPVFDDYDRVMGFSTPQRLLREQIMEPGTDYYTGKGACSVATTSTVENGLQAHDLLLR